MITLIILMLIWIIWSLLEGFTQGHYYDTIPTEVKKHRNMHPFFAAMRAIVLGLLSYEVFMTAGGAATYVFIFCSSFIFSLFHNGMYYITRNNLNPNIYKKRFWDKSETSEAFIELGTFRFPMFIIGILVYTYLLIDLSNLNII